MPPQIQDPYSKYPYREPDESAIREELQISMAANRYKALRTTANMRIIRRVLGEAN